MNPTFKTVALIGKHKSADIAGALSQLGGYLRGRELTVLMDAPTAELTGSAAGLTMAQIGERADLAIVLGGDGTLLNIARALAPYDVPLVGINQGRLGFLTDLSTDTVRQDLGAMLDGRYSTERRMMLGAQVLRAGANVFAAQAFNDVVVHRGGKGSMIEFEVRVDGEYVYALRADGLIVATPTGSTAYALSAGGPILHPGLDLIALVPVCPHTFSNRPIVVGPDAVVEILMHRSDGVRVYFDSHAHFDTQADDKIVVRRAPHSVTLLHPEGHSYYRMLREKLGWSGFA